MGEGASPARASPTTDPTSAPWLLQRLLWLLLLLLLLLLSLCASSDNSPEFLTHIFRWHAASDSTPVRCKPVQGVLLEVELGCGIQAKDRRR